jgi:hypothetical protein
MRPLGLLAKGPPNGEEDVNVLPALAGPLRRLLLPPIDDDKCSPIMGEEDIIIVERI